MTISRSIKNYLIYFLSPSKDYINECKIASAANCNDSQWSGTSNQ